MSKQRKIVNDFRELLVNSKKLYGGNIAYKFKKDFMAREPEYIEKTYDQTIADVKALSTALLNMELQGEKVVVIGKNRYEWCISYLAVTTGDMVIVPLDRALPDNEIELLVKRSEAKVIIFDNEFLHVMKEIGQKDSNNVEFLICMDETKQEQVYSIAALLGEGKKQLENGDTKYDEISVDNNKMSVLLFTSGTSDAPKAVMLSQYNICSNFCNCVNHFKMLPTDILLSFLPMHHTFESSITFLYGFYSGATVAFCDGLKHIQKNLKEYKVNIFVAVPLVLETIYKKIIKTIEQQGKTKLIKKVTVISNALLKLHIDIRKILFKPILENFGGQLRMVLYGGAIMSKDTIVGLNNFGIKTIQGYGLTETSPVVTAESETKVRPGSVGYPLDNIKIKIDEPNEEGIGEILVKGSSVMIGYYKNEEATGKVLQEGWFKTGDIGYIDSDGFLYITGRKKDVIVLKNGKNIYPEEIEFLIRKIPYVAEAMVYARERNNTDTLLCAKVVYDETLAKEMLGNITEEDFKEAVWKNIETINQTLPVYKHIESIIVTTKPLIKTTTQKVKRHEEKTSLQEI